MLNFTPIMFRPCSIVTVIRCMDRPDYELMAYRLLREIGTYETKMTLSTPNFASMIEYIGEATNVHNYEELFQWMERVYSAFNLSWTEAQVEWYVYDLETKQYGTVLVDDYGRQWVEFTKGGPYTVHEQFPLSDYCIQR